ncbi:MAG: hypothetical protein Kow0031_39980 [Anaerolineae bacterium]
MDRINILEPNGVERTRPLTPKGLRIGRGTDNDVVLGYDDVSRYHAEITFNGQFFLVTDLGSANGTLMGKNRLPPNTPSPWGANYPLTIGRVQFRLLASARSTASMPAQDSGYNNETIVGRLPDDYDPGKRINLLLIAAMLALMCVCAMLAVAGYLFW